MQPNVTDWTAPQRKYMLWVATPRELREPASMEQFCKQNRVSRQTLWRWKRAPGFWTEVQALTQQFMADAVPETLESLKEMARRGSLGHQKLYFEMLNMYVPKIAPTNPEGTEPWSGLPDAAIDREINAIIDAARARASDRAPQ